MIRALDVVVTGTDCLTRCLWLIDVGVVRRLDGAGDISVEVLFPQGRECLERGSCSGGSLILGIDAISGPPHGYVADECGARVASRPSPDWLIAGSDCEVSNLAGEVGDVLCSLGQVVTPGGTVLNRAWNLWEPGQRS